ncbi:hypothetical protein GCM10027051_12110 [Niabella terrae]
MSQVLEEKIKSIQDKLQLLIRRHAAIVKENQSLRNALDEAKQQTLAAAGAAEALQHQLDAKKYSQNGMEPGEKKAFEKKINGYIKEIDKCIALLSV